MLRIIVPGEEFWDEVTETFSTVNDQVIELQHSLLSVSKWESKYQIPFLSTEDKTTEQIYDYIRCMSMTPIDEEVFTRLTAAELSQVNDHVDSPESATTFGTMPDRKGRGETITSELMYYWMVAFEIPFECEKWHLNRLFALIRICNIKNSPPEKRSRHQVAQQNREINAKRREALQTNG